MDEMARADWALDEIELVLDLYAEMLHHQRDRRNYSKAEMVRGSALITRRTRGSIERKLQNVSAVRDELGLDWVDGYKPLQHYQAALGKSIRKRERLAE